MTKVSFITPLFNCLPLTQAMLASLQSTLPPGLDHEIILVDDGSTDGTRAWLATLRPPIRVVLHERNLGYAAANNRGAALATGDILALLNNDLVLTPGWLPPMLAALHRPGERAGVVGNVQRAIATRAIDHAGMCVDLQGRPEHIRELPPPLSRVLAPVRQVPFVTGACMLVRTAVWRELGGFDEGFVNGCEEVDFCLRARAAGRVNVVALRSVIGHHVSASPGRNARNLQNIRRLTLRWRDELARLGARRWCGEFLRREWLASGPAAGFARAAAALGYALHLRTDPPAFALDGMHAAIAAEMAHQDRLLTGTGRA